MATGPFQPHGPAIQEMIQGTLDLNAITAKVMLVATAATINPSTTDFVDDVRANEVTGTNWAADGQTVTLTITHDDATDQVRVEVQDISVATVTLTDGKYAILYNSTPATDATRHIIGSVTFDTALAPTAGTLAITFPAPTFWFDYTP